MTDTPPPGSDAAINLGCTCPVMDNRRGRGFMLNGEQVWWYTMGCPVHSQGNEKSSDD